MKSAIVLLAGAAESYSGICHLLPASRYATGIKAAWRTNGEHATIELDFDNGSKLDTFALNDETYLLFHFNQNLDHLATSALYPIGLGQMNPADEPGCTDCSEMCTECPQGHGWTEPNVFYMEIANAESGKDFNSLSTENHYLEWIWSEHVGGFNIIEQLDYIEVCQGISPTVQGLTAQNQPLTNGCTTLDTELFHSWAIWRATYTAHMGIEGSVPFVAGDFIEVGFDGYFYDFNVFDRNSPVQVTQPDSNLNVYQFILGDMELINNEYWVITFMAKLHGGSWHTPAIQWLQLCPGDGPTGLICNIILRMILLYNIPPVLMTARAYDYFISSLFQFITVYNRF